MNRTIVIFNILVVSISTAKPIEETSASALKTKDDFTNTAIARNSDRTDHDSFITVNNDDLLRTSDIIKVYNSEENVIAKTRNLKEQPENEQYEKAELKDESRTIKDSKPLDTFAAIPEKKVGTPAKGEIESKASKEEDKTPEVTSESNKLEGSATTLKIESKSSDHLENDKVEEKVNEKIAPNQESKRRSLEINNDESNSAWDVLDDIDDIPSRRMFSPPDDLNIISKAKSDDKQVESTQVKIAAKPNYKPSNDQPYGSIQTPTLIPRPHPVLPGQRFSLPAMITLRTAVPIDFRRILSEERSKLINQNRQNEISSESDSNDYPYTPQAKEIPKISKVPPNSILMKLTQASEHPQKGSTYFGGENSNILLGLPYYNMKPTYFIPQNYDAYKYVTGYGRIF